MAVKARFYVNSVQRNASGTATVRLNPSMKGEANKEWSKYTPSGEIVLNVTELAEPALAEFEDGIGQDFDITFERIAPAE